MKFHVEIDLICMVGLRLHKGTMSLAKLNPVEIDLICMVGLRLPRISFGDLIYYPRGNRPNLYGGIETIFNCPTDCYFNLCGNRPNLYGGIETYVPLSFNLAIVLPRWK